MTWLAIAVLGAGTYLVRLAGLLLRGRVTVPERLQRLLDLGAAALLVALAATAALTQGDGFAGWARPAGVAVAGVAALLKAPFVLVVVLAAATTAGLRLAGVP
ncbi:branched-chain amino acid transport [Pseudonocardia dioxanivorans CB1190]|uniref:Branched-chain amino acid transport n=1 Tax=Pseudonocardia dioxanivorans (strain ATCC 55486 / DSM 44775 / JCM 13855 / CB1190) TaxID=675635 RepID=F4D0B8_PSEUX|nr:AzlD domain-containing protein [Pseudonocardia dioxanivorans]AEA25774.1 branched-chain amino acid transport [Pseudonocardia dioxanivorans CB1190]